jgi:hypothetical protein
MLFSFRASLPALCRRQLLGFYLQRSFCFGTAFLTPIKIFSLFPHPLNRTQSIPGDFGQRVYSFTALLIWRTTYDFEATRYNDRCQVLSL